MIFKHSIKFFQLFKLKHVEEKKLQYEIYYEISYYMFISSSKFVSVRLCRFHCYHNIHRKIKEGISRMQVSLNVHVFKEKENRQQRTKVTWLYKFTCLMSRLYVFKNSTFSLLFVAQPPPSIFVVPFRRPTFFLIA